MRQIQLVFDIIDFFSFFNQENDMKSSLLFWDLKPGF
jgi:hypothetical protein